MKLTNIVLCLAVIIAAVTAAAVPGAREQLSVKRRSHFDKIKKLGKKVGGGISRMLSLRTPMMTLRISLRKPMVTLRILLGMLMMTSRIFSKDTFDDIKDFGEDVIDDIKDFGEDVIDGVQDAPEDIKEFKVDLYISTKKVIKKDIAKIRGDVVNHIKTSKS